MAAMHQPQFRTPSTNLWCDATRAAGKRQGESTLQRRRRSTMAWLPGLTNKAVNRERVLVVDDDAETRESVGQALDRAGFAPTRAATGEQGLVLLREWPRRIGCSTRKLSCRASLMAGS